MPVQVVILAAGMGTRLGKPWPKPLTPLADGRSIMQQQIENLRKVFKEDLRLSIVVGFKLEMIMEAHPDATYVYNEIYDQTNTSKSLLKALKVSHESGVLWLNGDVVFDSRVLERVSDRIHSEKSFICVNTAAVGEEEVKYTVNQNGFVKELSKQVQNALGEAVGINFISKQDKAAVINELANCADNDYFERGLELAIEKSGIQIEPVDISDLFAVEVDFQADLDRANSRLN
ncbi:MAG: phosphocholine cytidylyltransferase family protein [Actinobacteria bacterium]|nr:phosphocholine cytidylyltransferase family protein [Actinomycetota bacterium]